MHASHSFTRKARTTRNVWSISRDHVLYDDINYLVPILNSIEEEDEYRRGRNKESNSDSLLLSSLPNSFIDAFNQVEEMHQVLASPTKIVSSYDNL